MSLKIKQMPVFVFPNIIKFYLGSKTVHKQLLTVYNPYHFPVKFKVLSNAPNKYSVIDSEGILGPHAGIDILIRHNIPTVGNCHIVDIFRISLQDSVTKQFLGQRDVDAVLLQDEKDDVSSDGDFHSISFSEKSSTTNEDNRSIVTYRSLPSSQPRNCFIALIIGLVCIVALLLPTQEELHNPSSILDYLHISWKFKLVLAYVLGLVTMVILKP